MRREYKNNNVVLYEHINDINDTFMEYDNKIGTIYYDIYEGYYFKKSWQTEKLKINHLEEIIKIINEGVNTWKLQK